MVKVKIRTMKMGDGESITVPRVVNTSRVPFEKFVAMMADGGRMTATEAVAAFSLMQGVLADMLQLG